MKIINIPEDINDIVDLSEFKKTIKEIRKFEKNIKTFAEKIARDKFLKTIEEWSSFLSESDKNKCGLDNHNKNSLFLYDYVDKKLIRVHIYSRGWIMGAVTAKTYKFEFNNDATIIIITVEWETQEARFSHIPWIKQKEIFYIDYINNRIISEFEFKSRKKGEG